MGSAKKEAGGIETPAKFHGGRGERPAAVYTSRDSEMQRSSRTKAGSRPFFIRRRNIVRLQTIENLTARLTEQLGHAPADKEVAGMLAMSVQKLRRMRSR